MKRQTRTELTQRVNNHAERLYKIEQSINDFRHKLELFEIKNKLNDYGLTIEECRYNSIKIFDEFGEQVGYIKELKDFENWFVGYKSGLEDGTIIVELNEEETKLCKEQMNCGCKTKTATKKSIKKSK